MKQQKMTDETSRDEATDVLDRARDVFRNMRPEERAEILREFYELCERKI